jgi:hypothetical protein
MKPQTDVIGIVQELIHRGWRVTNAHDHGDKVSVAFELMNGVDPTWHKAVEVPAREASPNEVERVMRAWQAKVRLDIRLGRPSPVIRRMIAEHGQDAVDRALNSPLGVLVA